jgi:hypothetical protein
MGREKREATLQEMQMEEIKSIMDVMFGDHNDPELTRILNKFIKKEDETDSNRMVGTTTME